MGVPDPRGGWPRGDRAKATWSLCGPILFPGIVTALWSPSSWSRSGGRRKEDTAFKLNEFSKVPISYEGRVMPLDSLAANTLRILSGKSTLTIDGKTEPAIRFLTDVLAD